MDIKTRKEIVTIDGIDVPMRISGATYILYRNEFHKDMFVQMNELNNGEVTIGEDGQPIAVTIPEGAVGTLLEMGYIMAKQGDPKMSLTFIEWLDQFSYEGITNDGLMAIASMIQTDKETLDEAKKKTDQQIDQ